MDALQIIQNFKKENQLETIFLLTHFSKDTNCVALQHSIPFLYMKSLKWTKNAEYMLSITLSQHQQKMVSLHSFYTTNS